MAAPVDFPGTVLPIPDGRDPNEFKPRADTDPPYAPPLQGGGRMSAKNFDGKIQGWAKTDKQFQPDVRMQEASAKSGAPTRVHLPDGNIGEFPASMGQAEIEAVLRKQYPAKPSTQATMSAWHPGMWDQLKSAVPSLGEISDKLTGRKPMMSSMKPEDTQQLAFPERVFSPSEQEKHPIRTGVDEFAGALTSPDNLLLMQGLGALGAAPKSLGRVLPRVASAVFAGQMGKGAYDLGTKAHAAWQQYKQTGDEQAKNEAMRLGTHAILNGAMSAMSGLHATSSGGHPADAEVKRPNPTEQISTADRPAANPIAPERQPGGTEYERLKARLAQLEQSKRGPKSNGKVQPTEATATAKAQESTPSPVSTEARGEPLPSAQESKVTPTLQDVAADWKKTAQRGPSPERQLLSDMVTAPAEDVGAKVRQQMPPMPRGERRAVPRSPEEQQTQTLFAQARKELGEDATSDQVMARVDELKGKKPDVRDLYATPEAKEAPLTPEQNKANREAYLNMTKKYSGENAIGPREESGWTAETIKNTGFKSLDVARNAGLDAFGGNVKNFKIKQGPRGLYYVESSGRNLAPHPEDVKTTVGPGLGPSGIFKGAPQGRESEAGSFSLRPKKLPPNQQPGLVHRLREAVADSLNPSKDAQDTMNIIRERGAEYAQNVEQMAGLLENHVKSHDSDGDAELRQFMDAGEGKPGAQFANSTDKQVADILHDEFQKRWQKLAKLPGREDQGQGIENYLKHLFVGPKGQSLAERIMYGKRPLKGPATFEKHRFYEYLSDGMDMGAVPVTYNPIRMQMLGLFEIDRYLMAHDMKNDMKASGLIKFYKMGEKKPDGWQRINDQIFQPRVRTKGGLIEYGNYYAPKDAAKIFNNYLSPGLRGNLAYDVVRNYGNLLNQFQLGFSAYHGAFSALNSGANDLALGLQKAMGGDIAGGLHNAIRGILVPWSARSNYKLGKMIEQEYVTPGSNPSVERLARALKEGGGRIGIDPMWENRAVEAFKRQLKSNPLSLKTPFHGVEALAEKVSAPIMKYFVPRLKIGAFANLAEHKLAELNANGASHNEVVTELGKLWDSVDNRMGQMTYDNLFWKKTYKDMGMLGVRSLGWNLGSFREAGGALKDTALQALGKQKIQLTPRQAYIVALPMLVGLYGTVLGHLMGHPPHSTEDRFFPQTGGVDASGKPERLSLPSYMRDVYAFKHHPAETMVHKAHPLIAELAELYENHDFYNTEIRDTEAPLGQQAWQVSKYLGKNFVPFGISASIQRHNAGEAWQSALGGEIGLTPAPKYIGQSKAEELAYDLAKRHMETGPFPAGTQQQRQFQYQVRTQFHAGKLTTGDLLNMVKSGKLSPAAAGAIADEKGQPPLIRHFNTQGMSWDERLKIWDAATPEEQAELKPYLLQHVSSLDNLLPEQRQAVEKRLRDIFVKK